MKVKNNRTFVSRWYTALDINAGAVAFLSCGEALSDYGTIMTEYT